MKKLLFALSLLLITNYAYSAPSNTMSVPNTFTNNTTADATQVNADFNAVNNTFNAHTHTDITQLGTITSGIWTGTAIGLSAGGTGASTASDARTNLGLGSLSTVSTITLTTDVTGILPIANGGTASSSTTYCDLATNVTGTLPVANGGTALNHSMIKAGTFTGNDTQGHAIAHGLGGIPVAVFVWSLEAHSGDGFEWYSGMGTNCRDKAGNVRAITTTPDATYFYCPGSGNIGNDNSKTYYWVAMCSN